MPPADPSSPPHSPRSRPTYAADDVQAILSKALELRSADRFTAEQLQEMATELNITPDLLAAAEADWRSQQHQDATRQVKRDRRQRRRRRQWLRYVFASILMVGIDIATTGMLTWSPFPVLGWGLALAFGKQGHFCQSANNYSMRR